MVNEDSIDNFPQTDQLDSIAGTQVNTLINYHTSTNKSNSQSLF